MGHAVGGHQQPSIPAMEREDAPTGRHALGPHVVGMRVVVRRVLPGQTGPTGGPAMTDVLGVCEAWGDGVATLRRDDGSVVEIATRDIVSGKPVPPRPSARMRVSPREAAAFLAAGWRLVVPGEAELRLASLATTRRGLPRCDDAELTEDGPRVRAVVGHSRGDAALDGSWLGVHGMVTDPSY